MLRSEWDLTFYREVGRKGSTLGAKYKEILKENPLDVAEDLSLKFLQHKIYSQSYNTML